MRGDAAVGDFIECCSDIADSDRVPVDHPADTKESGTKAGGRDERDIVGTKGSLKIADDLASIGVSTGVGPREFESDELPGWC
jgi:hypothetical protein